MSWWPRCWSITWRSKVQFSSPSLLHLILRVGKDYLWVLDFMEWMWSFIFWNFPFKKIPCSIFPSSIQNVPFTYFPMSNWIFPLSIKGHVQNSHSFHIPFQALWTTGHEREFWEISPLGHKWKFHVTCDLAWGLMHCSEDHNTYHHA